MRRTRRSQRFGLQSISVQPGQPTPSPPPAAGPLPIHPILLAAYFVLFLYSVNLEEAELGDVLPVLALVVTGTAVLLVAAGRLAHDTARAALVVSALVVAVLAYGHVAGILAPLRIGTGIQQVGWAALVGGTAILAWRAGRWLSVATRALNVLGVALVLVTLSAIVPYQLTRAVGGGSGPAPSSPDPEPTGPPGSGPLRDIYYLVWDRYPSANSARLAYGVENRAFDELRRRGFYVASDSHANYQRTTLSLASTLSLEFLDGRGRVESLGPVDTSGGYTRIQNSVVARFLKSRGYYYVHIGSDFSPTRTSVIADANLAYDNFSDFGAAFVETTAVPGIARRFGLLGSRWERRYAWTRWELDRLEGLGPYPRPTLVFAHFLLPHTPYIFDRDGRFVTDEENRARSATEAFAEQLEYTNRRMLAIVDRLLAVPEAERPIIILQADEGPYPPDLEDETRHDWTTATPEEREIKFGILNAWYLPGGRDIGLYPAISSVNTFRVLFDAYFGLDIPLLPDESFSLGHDEPLEFPAP
jgi:hypothetical protein